MVVMGNITLSYQKVKLGVSVDNLAKYGSFDIVSCAIDAFRASTIRKRVYFVL